MTMKKKKILQTIKKKKSNSRKTQLVLDGLEGDIKGQKKKKKKKKMIKRMMIKKKKKKKKKK